MLRNALADPRSLVGFFDDLAADIETIAKNADADGRRSAAAWTVAKLRVFERLFEGIAWAYLHEPEGIVYRKLHANGVQTAHQLLKACQAEAIDQPDLPTIQPVMQRLLKDGAVDRSGHLWRLRPSKPRDSTERAP